MFGSSLTGRGNIASLVFSRLTMPAIARNLATLTVGAVPVGSRRIWAFPAPQIPLAAVVQLARVGVEAPAHVVTARAIATATAATSTAKRKTRSTDAAIGRAPRRLERVDTQFSDRPR